MNDFEGPATHWIWLTVIGGLVTGLGLIMSLEIVRDRLPHQLEPKIGSDLVIPLEEQSP